MNAQELVKLLDGCRRQERASQHRLHAQYYHYAMTVARRYAGNQEAAEEVVNDVFFKVFTKIQQFVPGGGDLVKGFTGWFRRIVVNTAIDRCRADIGQPELEAWTHRHDGETDPGIPESLTFGQILALLDQLPPAYRTVFNLHVADGYSHEEIAELLGISVGASKSNLSRARQHIKRLLTNEIAFDRKL